MSGFFARCCTCSLLPKVSWVSVFWQLLVMMWHSATNTINNKEFVLKTVLLCVLDSTQPMWFRYCFYIIELKGLICQWNEFVISVAEYCNVIHLNMVKFVNRVSLYTITNFVIIVVSFINLLAVTLQIVFCLEADIMWRQFFYFVSHILLSNSCMPHFLFNISHLLFFATVANFLEFCLP